MEKITFEKAKEWIRQNYEEDKVNFMFDDEVYSGDWIDREQFEEEDYEDEHEYYIDYGHGEAESSVINNIFHDLNSHFELDFVMYSDSDETNLHRFMCEEYTCLYSG